MTNSHGVQATRHQPARFREAAVDGLAFFRKNKPYLVFWNIFKPKSSLKIIHFRKFNLAKYGYIKLRLHTRSHVPVIPGRPQRASMIPDHVKRLENCYSMVSNSVDYEAKSCSRTAASTIAAKTSSARARRLLSFAPRSCRIHSGARCSTVSTIFASSSFIATAMLRETGRGKSRS